MTGLPVVVAWSGGKDSSLALERLRANPNYEVVGLVTTVTAGYDRISIHGVRRSLLALQADAVGLPVVEALLPAAASNAEYEARFAEALAEWRRRVPDLRHVAFGDLFLADIRSYREAQLGAVGMEAVFPVWGEPTGPLAHDLIARGYRAILVCVDLARLPAWLAGRTYDEALLAALPAAVDPCGENGEFHTFVTDGPVFRSPLAVRVGETVERGPSAFADLLPAAGV
jgi:uncharacterized protein (TIGR00290 family)